MRIVGGRFKGRTIRAPKNLPVRPTTDMAKEGLFNILFNRIEFSDTEVLDLFCGTGNISFEFQSRGVLATTSVDGNYKCTSFVSETMKHLNCENARVIKSDALRFVSSAKQKWDVIFADPPYDFPKYPELVNLIFEKSLVAEDGCLIVEHPGEIDFSTFEHFKEVRKYGRVHFSFFELEA